MLVYKIISEEGLYLLNLNLNIQLSVDIKKLLMQTSKLLLI